MKASALLVSTLLLAGCANTTGNYIGAFTGNATGRSRIRGTLEYRRGDQTETRTADVTFLRAGF